MARVAILLTAAFAAATSAALASTPPADVLLARHAPMLVLHPSERFVPSPVGPFLAASDVLRRDGASWLPHPGGIGAALGEAEAFRLDVRDCASTEALAAVDCYAALSGDATAYGAVHRRGSRIVLQYWLFYPFNLWSPVTPLSPDFWQAHEGDWEQVSVVLDGAGRPLAVAASRHCSGVQRAWARAPKRGVRPVVHVSLGSHANGFRAGPATVEPRCWPREGLAVYRAYGVPLLDHAAAGRALTPRVVPVTAARPAWMRFPGTWGEDQYAHFPNVTIRFGAGPTGPARKAVWRDPLSVLRWPAG
jgi:Vacuolar protein sorting-associated protein 62